METERLSVFAAEQMIEELLEAHTNMKYVRKYVMGDGHPDYVMEVALRFERARREVLEAMVRP